MANNAPARRAAGVRDGSLPERALARPLNRTRDGSLNGSPLVAPDAAAVAAMLDMASGALPEAEFTAWVRRRITPA